jgi:SAM-dependent methyltransferase
LSHERERAREREQERRTPLGFDRRHADVYDAWYGVRSQDATTEQSVAFLADVAAGGRVLELAIGTGRVALPLAETGLEVHGIEASEPMVEKLREKPGGDAIPVTIGDMADVGVEGSFDLVFLVFNTIFNLPTQDDQVRCFRNVAEHLTERGSFVIETYVPDTSGFVDGQALRTVHIDADSTVLEASIHDPLTQTVDYRYIVLGERGVQQLRVPMRYAWPSELDLMARLAGLELQERFAGWDRAPFTATSPAHVSVYGRPRLGAARIPERA